MVDKAWLEIIKENVYEYISAIDYAHPDFDVNVLKADLSKIIGTTPAVQIKWASKVESINELKRDAGMDPSDYEVRKEVPNIIDIVFVDDDNMPIKLQYIA